MANHIFWKLIYIDVSYPQNDLENELKTNEETIYLYVKKYE